MTKFIKLIDKYDKLKKDFEKINQNNINTEIQFEISQLYEEYY